MNKENDIFFFHRYNYISIDQIKEIVRLIEVFNHFSWIINSIEVYIREIIILINKYIEFYIHHNLSKGGLSYAQEYHHQIITSIWLCISAKISNYEIIRNK